VKYATAQAFRQALEEKIRREHKGKDIPRIRKNIVFERLMARLDERWILKGGYAIQLRTEKARTTQDVDLLATEISMNELEDSFRKALEKDIGDHFVFFTAEQESIQDTVNSVRFQVTARVAGRIFERFHVDIGINDPLFQPIDKLTPPNYLEFAQIATFSIPCYSIYQHIAEKVHAIWRPREVPSSRVKDLADLVLMTTLASNIQVDKLREAIHIVFEKRGDQAPDSFHSFPADWQQRYNRLAKELELDILDYKDAIQAVSSFISPVLSGSVVNMTWDSIAWVWDINM
jgi:hypothetical protein